MKTTWGRTLVLALAPAVLLLACGNGSGSPNGFDVEPASVDVAPGSSVKLTVSGAVSSGPVVWRVEEADGGTVDAEGNYTAPSTEGTYHVVASCDERNAAPSVIHVASSSASGVAINPKAATLAPGDALGFEATVSQLSSTTLTWSVEEGAAGGTITQGGAYTAPAAPGTYHVVVASAVSPNIFDTAAVTVSSSLPTPTGAVAASPASLALGTVYVGQTRAFSVVVRNVSGNSLTISSIAVSGSGLTEGLSLPATLAPGASAWFAVTFAPTSAGSLSGTLDVMDGATALAAIPVTATGVVLDSSNSVSVVDYGAKGDGVTDDRAAFQAAADAAGTAKVLYVPQPPGGAYYSLSGVVLVQGSVVGQPGASRPELRMVGANGADNPGGASPYTILYYKGNTSGTVVAGLHLNGGRDFAAGTDVYGLGEQSHGLVLQDVSDAWIENNLIEATQGDSIQLGGEPGTSAVADVRVVNNVLHHPMRCAVFPGDTSGLQVFLNTISKVVEYQSSLDFEPNIDGQSDWNAEVAYNDFDLTLEHDHGVITSTIATGIPSPGGDINVHANWGAAGSYSFYVDLTPAGSAWSGNTIETSLPTSVPLSP
jgi:Pectate lyase superfamily protein